MILSDLPRGKGPPPHSPGEFPVRQVGVAGTSQWIIGDSSLSNLIGDLDGIPNIHSIQFHAMVLDPKIPGLVNVYITMGRSTIVNR